MSESVINISKNKQSLEYIPSPCTKSKKHKALRRIMGKIAALMYNDLLEYIGSQKNAGYWVLWDQETKEDFAVEYDYTVAEIEINLNYYFEKSFFSKEIFEKYNILTGEEIQQYWLLCAKKRMRFVEGIIEQYMVISFEKEVDENKKRFSRFYKMIAEEENIEDTLVQMKNDEIERYSMSTPQEYLHESPTSLPIQHKAISKSKSEAKSNSSSKKQEIIHPTDVVSTFGNFSSTGEIINSISSELLLGCFEAEKNEINQNSNQTTQTNKNSSPPSDSAKSKKTPHPARVGIISIWEKGNNLVYVQDKENNMAIPPLIRKLEGLITREGDIVSDISIIQKFTWLWTSKGMLSEFLQKQYRNFTSLDKYFNEIVSEIRDNSKKHLSKQNQAVRQPAYMRFISEIPD
jgi:hypothetical protein